MAEKNPSLLEIVGEIIKEEIVPEAIRVGNDKLVQGVYELGGLWTGNAYRGDLGLLTTGAAPEQAAQTPEVQIVIQDSAYRGQFQSQDQDRVR